MRLPVIIASILSLGLGFALGSIFSHRETSDVTAVVKPPPVSTVHPATSSSTTPAADISDLTALQKEPNAIRQTDELLAYVRSVPTSEIPGILPEVQKMNGALRDQALIMLIYRWVESDPDGAHRALARMPEGQARFLLAKAVFAKLAATDPVAALRAANELPNQQLRTQAVTSLIQAAAQRDPAKALALFQESKITSGNIMGSVFGAWVDKDLAEATKAAMQLAKPRDQKDALLSIATHLGQGDTQAALNWIEQLPPGDTQNTARQSLLSRIAYRDPKAAADYLGHMENVAPGVETSLIQSISSSWSRSDPRASLDWAQNLPPSQSRSNAMEIGISYWTRNDPQAAIAYVTGMQPENRDTLLPRISSIWAQTDPKAAFQWSSQMPDGKVKTNAQVSALYQWGANNPAEAMAFAQTLTDTSLRTTAIPQLASSWASSDPSGAAKWLASAPDDPQSKNLYSTIAYSWTRTDPTAASNWLAQLPSGPNRDTAIRSFTEQLSSSDPASALRWAGSIGNTDSRNSQIEEVLRRWRTIDPTAAAAATQQSSLPEQTKQQILAPQR